jgi:hypothetical protein
MSDNCRSCDARVIWSVTERGRRMPVDYQPLEKGNLLLTYRPNLPPLAVYHTKEEIAALPALQKHRLRLSHFVTCPQRKKWRKK